MKRPNRLPHQFSAAAFSIPVARLPPDPAGLFRAEARKSMRRLIDQTSLACLSDDITRRELNTIALQQSFQPCKCSICK